MKTEGFIQKKLEIAKEEAIKENERKELETESLFNNWGCSDFILNYISIISKARRLCVFF